MINASNQKAHMHTRTKQNKKNTNFLQKYLFNDFWNFVVAIAVVVVD